MLIALILLGVVTAALILLGISRNTPPASMEPSQQAPHPGQAVVLLPLINRGETPSRSGYPSPLTEAAPLTVEATPGPEKALTTTPSPQGEANPSPTASFASGASPTLLASPSSTQASSFRQPTSTPPTNPTASATRTPTSQGQLTATPTGTGVAASLWIQKDRGCVDTRYNELYIFGEIVNNTAQAYDIMDISARVFDAAGEIPVTYSYFDMPNNSFVFANSTIPFVLYAAIDRPNFTRYELTLDAQANVHTPRNDLHLDEYTINLEQGFTQIKGKWSFTNLSVPPDTVSIYATAYDAQGRVSNLGYIMITTASVIDPWLPPGQHSFENLYLEDSPCGSGNIVVSILGE